MIARAQLPGHHGRTHRGFRLPHSALANASVGPGPMDRPRRHRREVSGRQTKSKWRLCPREGVTAANEG